MNVAEDSEKHSVIWRMFMSVTLDDPIFHGQWTNLHDQSQNGPKPVTNA